MDVKNTVSSPVDLNSVKIYHVAFVNPDRFLGLFAAIAVRGFDAGGFSVACH